ncbi:hypothetical protein BGM19_38990 [Streptomyces agglomeratus]|uniref:hypothetical protein n=1 Tax=Streptomyces agglomeratus TaxID=285458 RepID=UPI00086C65DE|nr:hypothetical protein [Streptomyces agglomeratus]OEJ56622.1 hypothetical protein BGM19_38990 [Streptomyces agglomeratus]
MQDVQQGPFVETDQVVNVWQVPYRAYQFENDEGSERPVERQTMRDLLKVPDGKRVSGMAMTAALQRVKEAQGLGAHLCDIPRVPAYVLYRVGLLPGTSSGGGLALRR